MARKYGMIPSIPPMTTKFYSATKFKTEAELPNKVDLRDKMMPVRDQGDLGSCTAFGIFSGLGGYLYQVDLSPLFGYYEERAIEGTAGQDAGAMIVDGMEVFKTIGCCLESEDPYIIDNFTASPTDRQVREAIAYKIAEYHTVPSTALLKTALAEGNPVVIGIQVYSSFESDAVAQTGYVPIPDTENEQLLGGHCMCAAGYDLDMVYKYPDGKVHKEFVLVRNSWGASWGQQGYCWLPFAFFWTPGLVSDYWIGTLK